MSIVSSVIVFANVQRDGRFAVRERHTDQVGLAQFIDYLAEASDDRTALMTNRVPLLNAQLTALEIANNLSAVTSLGSLASPTFVYSTAAQNVVALRAAYQAATDRQAIFIGDFLSTLTSGQLQAAFGLTAGQVTTLQANKLTPAAALAANLRTVVGQ